MNTYNLRITGGIWMPYGAKAATEATFNAETDEDAIDEVMTSHSGDFSSVDDFQLMRTAFWREDVDGNKWRTIQEYTIVRDWQSEEGEMQWYDCMFPGEEEQV